MNRFHLVAWVLVAVTAFASAQPLTSEEILADIDQFEQGLEERFAYLEANGVDYEAELTALRQKAGEGMTRDAFGLELTKVLALFIDGHAEVDGFGIGSDTFLSFLIEPVGERYVAFYDNRERFVNPAYPYLLALDGVELGEWLEVAKTYYPKGSPQYQTRHALRQLRDVSSLRAEMGLPDKKTLSVTLSNEAGDVFEREMPLPPFSPTYGTWFENPSGIIEGNVGYLRLEDMDEDAVEDIDTWLPEFKGTVGLIIDVRDNGGGTRDPLVELFPYFMTPDDPPHVANVAKYRLNEDFEEDHLENRFLFREDSPEFSAEEQDAIEKFNVSFSPEWSPPVEKFSAWHYLVISKDEADPRYFYDKPVVILTNPKVFSAADIFVGAFKGWRNVTIMGQPTGGGSASRRGFELANSGLEVVVASMASFQPSGLLYDGNGVAPDVLLEPHPSDFLKGGTDSVLDAAVNYVLEQSR